MYRAIDEVLINWLKTLTYKDGSGAEKPVENVIYSTPEKVFSKGNLNKNGRILLPAISLFRVSAVQNDTKWKYPTSRAMAYSYTERDLTALTQKNVGVIPVDISYQVDIWTKYQDDLQYLWYQITKAFNPDLRLISTFNINGYQIEIPADCYLEGLNDNSDLEPDEESDRKLRATADIRVEAYLPVDVKEWKLVRVVSSVIK